MTGLARRLLLAGGAVLLVALLAAAALGLGGGGPQADATGTGLPPATVEVTEGTLTQTQQVGGTLSFGDPAQLQTQLGGMVTWAAAPGDVIAAGGVLYKVDNQAVVLVAGSLPAYRTLGPGDSGPDVAQLEANLAAFGYTGFPVDDYYGWGTAAAVKAWQADLGLPQTGKVEPGRIVASPGEVRIAEVLAAVGTSVGPGSPVIAATGTTRVVTVALDVAKQQFVDEGQEAEVALPDGTTVEGTVSAIGTVATTAADGTTTIQVTVTIPDQEALGTFDSAPVGLELVTGEAADVLVVPVNALVALAGGGYGLEVVGEEGSVEYVAVETGMFAGGMVEVSGAGIDVGMTVGVAT